MTMCPICGNETSGTRGPLKNPPVRGTKERQSLVNHIIQVHIIQGRRSVYLCPTVPQRANWRVDIDAYRCPWCDTQQVNGPYSFVAHLLDSPRCCAAFTLHITLGDPQ